MVVITGGTGFVGSYLVHYWIEKMTEAVVNVYLRAAVGDSQRLSNLHVKYKPLEPIKLPAESHDERADSA
jgi:thioester reductase-like protein